MALDSSLAAVNSGLQRACGRLSAAAPSQHDLAEPSDPTSRNLLNRYVRAFENADVDGLARLLTDDVVLQMPPVLNWYVGRDRYAAFMRRLFTLRGTQWRALAIAANGQPPLAAYAPHADGTYRAHTLRSPVLSDPSATMDACLKRSPPTWLLPPRWSTKTKRC